MDFRDTSFFRDQSAELPTPASIFEQNPRLGAGVVRFSDKHLLVKVGGSSEIHLEEAQVKYAAATRQNPDKEELKFPDGLLRDCFSVEGQIYFTSQDLTHFYHHTTLILLLVYSVSQAISIVIHNFPSNLSLERFSNLSKPTRSNSSTWPPLNLPVRSMTSPTVSDT